MSCRSFQCSRKRGAASLYTKGSVVWPCYSVFEVRAHEFLRSMCIRYVTLGCYHIRWWYWSKKRVGLLCDIFPHSTLVIKKRKEILNNDLAIFAKS